MIEKLKTLLRSIVEPAEEVNLVDKILALPPNDRDKLFVEEGTDETPHGVYLDRFCKVHVHPFHGELIESLGLLLLVEPFRVPQGWRYDLPPWAPTVDEYERTMLETVLSERKSEIYRLAWQHVFQPGLLPIFQ